MQELFWELTQLWPEYRKNRTTSATHPAHELVVRQIPAALEHWTANPERYKFVGSDGQGNISLAPWFAVLDLEKTSSATRGYYLVYLLDETLSTLNLSIGFGAYQYQEIHGQGKAFFNAAKEAVIGMQVNTKSSLDILGSDVHSRLVIGGPKLTNGKDFQLRA